MKEYKDLACFTKQSIENQINNLIDKLNISNLTYRDKLEILLESNLLTGIGGYINDCPDILEEYVRDIASNHIRGVYYFNDDILDKICIEDKENEYSLVECEELYNWFVKNRNIGCQIDWLINPESFIKLIRDSFKNSVVTYTLGSCYKFYEILKLVYPDAEAWYKGIEGHVITKINNKYYDITGEIKPTRDTYLLSIEPNIEKQLKNCIYEN